VGSYDPSLPGMDAHAVLKVTPDLTPTVWFTSGQCHGPIPFPKTKPNLRTGSLLLTLPSLMPCLVNVKNGWKCSDGDIGLLAVLQSKGFGWEWWLHCPVRDNSTKQVDKASGVFRFALQIASLDLWDAILLSSGFPPSFTRPLSSRFPPVGALTFPFCWGTPACHTCSC